ncbi:MAG: NRDE family protein [Pseudomonas sp.]|nr:NRDE family protein [Pseudomonas sp.]
MCLMAFAWQVGAYPLTLLGNRDEFHARATREAGFWTAEGLPELLAGKDLEAGGTWLGATAGSRFAALTNIRAAGAVTAPRSRGSLVLDYLATYIQPRDYLEQLSAEADLYGGFNLILGDTHQLWYFNSHEKRPARLPPGVYGLSNGGLQSDWPKQQRLRDRLAANPEGDPGDLLDLLADPHIYPDADLPSTGVPRELERALSAAFITGEGYGTRASTFMRLDGKGGGVFVERRFGPMGVRSGESSWQLA